MYKRQVFQSEVFDHFLKGSSLPTCYAAVASVANRWLDLIDTRGIDQARSCPALTCPPLSLLVVCDAGLSLSALSGSGMQDSELIEYFSESSMMSKSLEEYGDRKSCAITTAKRLAQFLGDERIKDKGLACNYIVATCAPGRP